MSFKFGFKQPQVFYKLNKKTKHYKAIENTNLPTESASGNTFEDFATSLEVYYMLTRHNSKRSTQFSYEQYNEDYSWDIKNVILK